MATLTYEVLVDRGEKAEKCTILPHLGRPDFKIRRFARGRSIPALTGDLLLHVEGPALNDPGLDLLSVRTISLIDCQWKRIGPILSHLEKPWPRFASIPKGYKTAYPRKSRFDHDPDEGLATIEALFLAAAFCGKWDETLLSRYPFGGRFLQLNERLLRDAGLWPESYIMRLQVLDLSL